MDKSTPCTPERIRRSDHQRKPYFLRDFFSLKEGGGRFPDADIDVKLIHQEPEFLPILRGFYCGNIHSNDSNIEFFPDAGFFTIYSQIKRGLATHGRQHAVNIRMFLKYL